MSVTLAGGCRVTDMREGAPMENGTLRIWRQIGRGTGAQAISLRVLEFAAGISPGIRNQACDEILYVLEHWDRGRPARLNVGSEQPGDGDPTAAIFIDGWPFEVTSQTGIYLRPGQTLTVDNPGPEPLV